MTLGLRGPLEEEVIMAFHNDRRVLTGDIGQEGEIHIYTLRQETGSSNSGGQTVRVCVCWGSELLIHWQRDTRKEKEREQSDRGRRTGCS